MSERFSEQIETNTAEPSPCRRKRFVGAANISVHNVSPNDGRVDFVVMVDWGEPLNIVTDITVMDPPVEVVVGQ